MRTVEAHIERPPIPGLPWDESRGTQAMLWLIATEACLFSGLFFSYYYLGAQAAQWPIGDAPKVTKATIMLAILISSSVVLQFGEWASREGRSGRARALIGATIALGLAFITISIFEYKDHLKELQPWSNAYGSIFYSIISLHFAHVCVGLSMLGYVLLLPDLEGKSGLPHKALHNVGLYWHFVDTIWLLVVSMLYWAPNLEVH